MALWLLIPSISLISHTWLPFPPVVLFFMAAIPLFLYSLDPSLNPKALGVEKNRWIEMWPIGLYLAYMLLDQYALQTPIRSFWGVLNSALYFPILYLLFSARVDKKGKGENLYIHQKKIEWFLFVSAGVYILEAILRYAVSLYEQAQDFFVYQGIYCFKFGGPVCSDSNATGIHILIMLFFSLWWLKKLWAKEDFGKKQKRWYVAFIFVWIVLLALTLSRACYIAAFIGFIYFFLSTLKSKYIWMVVGVCSLLGVLALVLLYPGIRQDASFISKFQILYAFADYIPQISWKEWLFGIGFSRSEWAMGTYAHNYMLVFLVESGVLGFLFMLWFFVQTVRMSRGESFYILLPFAVATISSTITFLPDLYAVLAMICFANSFNRDS